MTHASCAVIPSLLLSTHLQASLAALEEAGVCSHTCLVVTTCLDVSCTLAKRDIHHVTLFVL